MTKIPKNPFKLITILLITTSKSLQAEASIPKGCSIPLQTDPKQCTKCLPGYHLLPTNKTCKLCPFNCLTCENETKCQTCNYGRYFNKTSNLCLSCPKNCFSCNYDSNDKVSCLDCANSYALHPDSKECINCPNNCEKCEMVEDKTATSQQILNNGKIYKPLCKECDSVHRLNKAAKCVDVYIEAFGISFMWGLSIFIMAIFGILFFCPKIFESVHKTARKSKLKNMKIYKKLRKKGDDEEIDYEEDEDDSSD